MAGNDIYLRSVPSDANAADVRLYDPTTPDSTTRLAGIAPVVARLPFRPRALATFGLVVGLGPSQVPAPVVTRQPVRPVVVAVRGAVGRTRPVVGLSGIDPDTLRIADLPKVGVVATRRTTIRPIVGRAPIPVTASTTRTPLAPTVVRVGSGRAALWPIVGRPLLAASAVAVPGDQRGGSSRRWRDRWDRARPLPLKTITVTVEVPEVVERPTVAPPPAYKKVQVALTVPAVPVARPSLQPVADALMAMRTTPIPVAETPTVDWAAIEAQLLAAFHAEQQRLRDEWTRKAVLAVLLIEES